MKRFPKILGVGVLSAIALAAAAQVVALKTRLSWTQADPGEGVTAYLVSWKTRGATTWMGMTVPATTNAVVIDVWPYGTQFSLQASNAYGLGPVASGILPSSVSFTITAP
jgi:asparagine N-glycosylation enzyme membrane subunit Stt3